VPSPCWHIIGPDSETHNRPGPGTASAPRSSRRLPRCAYQLELLAIHPFTPVPNSTELRATQPNMKIIRCDLTHAEAILAILNEAIVNTTALYDYHPRTPAMMQAWFDAKNKDRYPVVGAVNDAGELMGFASYGTFRGFPAYKYTVEHSVYIDTRFRRQGLGKTLLNEIIAAAVAQEYHLLIGGIDAANSPSIALHRSLGFTHCASIQQAGFKFGRWLDLEFYQLILPSPTHPIDG